MPLPPHSTDEWNIKKHTKNCSWKVLSNHLTPIYISHWAQAGGSYPSSPYPTLPCENLRGLTGMPAMTAVNCVEASFVHGRCASASCQRCYWSLPSGSPKLPVAIRLVSTVVPSPSFSSCVMPKKHKRKIEGRGRRIKKLEVTTLGLIHQKPPKT